MLQEHPVLQHLLSIGGEHALGVELDTTYVESFMFQGHNLSFVALGSDFKTIGEVLL